MNSRVPKLCEDEYKYFKAHSKRARSEKQIMVDLVHNFYPSLKTTYVLELEKKSDNWEITVKLPIQDKVCTIGTIHFRDFKKDGYCEPSVMFSNDTILEMAFDKKTLEETRPEKPDSIKEDPQLEMLEFLKKYKKVEQWFASTFGQNSEKDLLKALMQQPKFNKVQEFNIEEELTLLERSGSPYKMFWLFPCLMFLGIGMWTVSSFPLIGGPLLAAGGFIALVKAVLAYLDFAGNKQKIQEFNDLASCANRLSNEAVQLLMQTNAPVVGQQELTINIPQEFPLPVYPGPNDDLGRSYSHDYLFNPFAEQQAVNPLSYNSPLTQPAPLAYPYNGDDRNNPFVPQGPVKDWLTDLQPVYIDYRQK